MEKDNHQLISHGLTIAELELKKLEKRHFNGSTLLTNRRLKTLCKAILEIKKELKENAN